MNDDSQQQRRVFRPRVSYSQHGWFGEVYSDDASLPYWEGSRLTSWTASFAARRMARKLNRLEKRGLIR